MVRYLKLLFAISMIFSLGCTSSTEAQDQEANIELLPPTEFHQYLLDHPDILLIDIRTVSEYESGHLVESVNYDFYDGTFEKELKKLDQDEPVMLYCRSGGRSANAVEIMKEEGFQVVMELKGGISAWSKKGLEVIY